MSAHVDLKFDGSLARLTLRRADKLNARAAIIIGDNELTRQVATLRDFDSGEQVEVPVSELEARLKPFR